MNANSIFVKTPQNSIPNLGELRWNHSEKNQPHRSQFARDRDRILYSKSFLRLRGKTQVFMLQKNDYIRTRMTHSLEVDQLARSIASSLGQNIELVEAIALGHDVGHTPFGHVGERTLADQIQNDEEIPNCQKGFKHNLQALRLLCDLEKGADYPDYKGLNLTKYTLWGIAHHSSIAHLKDEHGNLTNPIITSHPVYDNYLNKIDNYWSFEGLIVALADEIAQRHHDIEDGLRYDIISREELLVEIEKFQQIFRQPERQCLKRLREEQKNLEDPVFNSLFSRLVINMYVKDAVIQTKANIRDLENKYNIKRQLDFQNVKEKIQKDDYIKCVSLSPQLQQLDCKFHEFLKSTILYSFQAQAMDAKAKYIIRKLYEAFINSPEQLPDTALSSFANFSHQTYKRDDVLKALKDKSNTENKGKLHRCIADYIGGMTDRYAYEEFDRLYGTRV